MLLSGYIWHLCRYWGYYRRSASNSYQALKAVVLLLYQLSKLPVPRAHVHRTSFPSSSSSPEIKNVCALMLLNTILGLPVLLWNNDNLGVRPASPTSLEYWRLNSGLHGSEVSILVLFLQHSFYFFILI